MQVNTTQPDNLQNNNNNKEEEKEEKMIFAALHNDLMLEIPMEENHLI